MLSRFSEDGKNPAEGEKIHQVSATLISFMLLLVATGAQTHAQEISLQQGGFVTLKVPVEGEETTAKSTIDVLRPPQSIKGFSGIPWGSPLAVVEEKLGKPEESMEIGNGAIAVSYKETILHEDVHTILLLSQKSGLMKGMYSIGFGRGNDCVRVYENFRDAVARAYPNLTQRENRPNSTVSVDFCDAVQIGEASRYTIWEDKGNGAYSVGVTLLPGEDRVRVRYESPMFLRWQEDWEQVASIAPEGCHGRHC